MGSAVGLRGAFSTILTSKETSRPEAQLTCHVDLKGWEHPWVSRENHSSPNCLSGFFLGNREVRTKIMAVPPSGVRGEDVS